MVIFYSVSVKQATKSHGFVAIVTYVIVHCMKDFTEPGRCTRTSTYCSISIAFLGYVDCQRSVDVLRMLVTVSLY